VASSTAALGSVGGIADGPGLGAPWVQAVPVALLKMRSSGGSNLRIATAVENVEADRPWYVRLLSDVRFTRYSSATRQQSCQLNLLRPVSRDGYVELNLVHEAIRSPYA
jgi:hypothetical protein